MLTLKGNELLLYPNNASKEGFSLSLYLFRVIWLNVYKVLLCLHCWGITTIRCPSMLAYGLANNNLVCILCFEDGLLYLTEIRHPCGATHELHVLLACFMLSDLGLLALGKLCTITSFDLM